MRPLKRPKSELKCNRRKNGISVQVTIYAQIKMFNARKSFDIVNYVNDGEKRVNKFIIGAICGGFHFNKGGIERNMRVGCAKAEEV
jgi:hypothetical protein